MKSMGSRTAAWSICGAIVVGLMILFASFATGQVPAGNVKPLSDDTEAQKEQRIKQDEREILQLRLAFPGQVDVYMAGSDMKQPTFAGVTINRIVELPGGLRFFGNAERTLVLDPSRIVAVRPVQK